ncbi:5'-methylthioadenosine/adenosylhomocysteine nucleosidase [Eikenella sp. S3360]|uniref:5'-methylthioadenosine/S-adenosylhomocysteine nucleosidase n=1 Tax=Eikenella glucosivorans TaxID=2766967 RepID=A0ABS0NDC5_9NEIS|nr:5'-methylthioadenosine/adenosylhomocysteine nucleosidase [Eikenella glucosivorans]MBH5330260.1 5'-methylthioadenosine/adenosylhomocysteine nucleosidase [Eikenella glucosivorans]
MPQTVALIGAMPPEIALLKDSLSNLRSEQVADFEIHCGEYAGKNVVLALSGIGKVNAALTTALVLRQYRPDCVINTGSAGGLGGGLKVGDVVIGTQTAHHDVDVTAFGYAVGHVPRMPARFESDPALCAAAEQAASAFEHAAVHRGLIVSGDQFVHSSESVAEVRRHFSDVQAVEMEAAAIAQSCHRFGVPFVVIRAISDLADEKADSSFETFLKTASVHSAKMVLRLIEAL